MPKKNGALPKEKIDILDLADQSFGKEGFKEYYPFWIASLKHRLIFVLLGIIFALSLTVVLSTWIAWPSLEELRGNREEKLSSEEVSLHYKQMADTMVRILDYAVLRAFLPIMSVLLGHHLAVQSSRRDQRE
ncbi:MAG: hypothetical protein DWQ01_04835 [Planctomycetota bacterium]|nr:MAG: hypothetical protein DWQ01_04835 [Planctomycetota bacterium]